MERGPITLIEKIIAWVGSVPSLILHTIIFIAFFALSFSGFLSWDLMFLILTTIVSLEAIYLAIFIQMTVNRHAQELEEVSEDVEDIQEDIDEIQEDLEEISEEEGEEVAAEEERKRRQMITLETLTKDVQRVLTDLEALKQKG
jgi:biopolymer transport protein ExbB/TolQ